MKALIIAFSVLFFSCTGKQDNYPDISIVIDRGGSYKYDLEKSIFTVYFLTKPPLEVPFALSADEKNKIKNKYYSLTLENLTGNREFEDSCSIAPKIFTVLKIKKKHSFQEITINSSCDHFSVSEAKDAKKVKDFIYFTLNILDSKPGISDAPISDIIYL